MYIAVYQNTFHGDLIPVGPFSSLSAAESWISENVKEDKQPLWNVLEVLDPSKIGTSPLAQKGLGVRPA